MAAIGLGLQHILRRRSRVCAAEDKFPYGYGCEGEGRDADLRMTVLSSEAKRATGPRAGVQETGPNSGAQRSKNFAARLTLVAVT